MACPYLDFLIASQALPKLESYPHSPFEDSGGAVSEYAGAQGDAVRSLFVGCAIGRTRRAVEHAAEWGGGSIVVRRIGQIENSDVGLHHKAFVAFPKFKFPGQAEIGSKETGRPYLALRRQRDRGSDGAEGLQLVRRKEAGADQGLTGWCELASVLAVVVANYSINITGFDAAAERPEVRTRQNIALAEQPVASSGAVARQVGRKDARSRALGRKKQGSG